MKWNAIIFGTYWWKIRKAKIGVNLIRKQNFILLRSSLLTVYKYFLRPHLDYANAVYDQKNLYQWTNKIKSVQQKAASAITGAIQVNSKRNCTRSLVLNF